MLTRAHAIRVIRTTHTSPPPTKLVVSFLEPTQPSTPSDIYYIKTEDRNVELIHPTETEEEQEMVQESIKTDELPSTTDLSEHKDTEHLFLLNRNDQG